VIHLYLIHSAALALSAIENLDWHHWLVQRPEFFSTLPGWGVFARRRLSHLALHRVCDVLALLVVCSPQIAPSRLVAQLSLAESLRWSPLCPETEATLLRRRRDSRAGVLFSRPWRFRSA
jgi:hypothetical protein